jgi:glycine/D-amino acid oxidase-like deaminating enzyme
MPNVMSYDPEIAVIGGGLVGMAVAYGLQRIGARVHVYDEGDEAFRASRGNFGLIWVQGKGATMPNYARWTRLSAREWREFGDELGDEAGLDLQRQQPGGFDYCLSESEAHERVQRLSSLRDALGGDYPFEYLDAAVVRQYVPQIGPQVVGATWCPEDGHVNPLYLLRSLHSAFLARGGTISRAARVERVHWRGDSFAVIDATGAERVYARVVLACGHGNARLAPQVGLHAPVVPSRGQNIITERLPFQLHYPSVQIRQVGEGGIQIGDSKEDVGFDDDTTPQVLSAMAARAARVYPFLARARVLRTWAALRVMSPDGYPIYDTSQACPGAALVTCHSGVTLAAAHARVLAPWLLGHQSPIPMETFSGERFPAA